MDAPGSDKRGWPPALVAGGAVAMAVLVALSVVFLLSGTDRRESSAHPAPPVSPPEPKEEIRQASWRFRTGAVGTRRGMSRSERRRLRAQQPRTARLVRDIYQGLFLEAAGERGLIRDHFTPAAVRKLVRSKAIGAPRAATEVKTVRRAARITIEAPRGVRAVARVHVKAKGRVGPRTFRVRHEATLWLERHSGRWRVLSFVVEQERVRK